MWAYIHMRGCVCIFVSFFAVFRWSRFSYFSLWVFCLFFFRYFFFFIRFHFIFSFYLVYSNTFNWIIFHVIQPNNPPNVLFRRFPKLPPNSPPNADERFLAKQIVVSLMLSKSSPNNRCNSGLSACTELLTKFNSVRINGIVVEFKLMATGQSVWKDFR